jgi:hypothetical protein
MKYKNLYIAFLYEIFAGFGTIISVGFIGPPGLATLAILGLRTFILDKENINDKKLYLEYVYKVLSNSLSIIFIMIISIVIIIQFIPVWQAKLPPLDVILVVLIPFFIMTHGVVGIINYSNYHQNK